MDEKITIETDEDALITDLKTHCCDLMITTENGKSITMHLAGDKLEITGDANLNEAAEKFFKYLLKPLVDDYIEEQLKTRSQIQ